MEIITKLLDVSEMTRSKNMLNCVKRIIIHENTINGDIQKEWEYINNLKKQDEVYYSIHYLIGAKNCIRCIPELEVSYCTRNVIYDYSSISISYEIEKKGYMDERIIENLRKIIKFIALKYDLNKENVVLHSDLISSNSLEYFASNRHIFDNIINKIWDS